MTTEEQEKCTAEPGGECGCGAERASGPTSWTGAMAGCREMFERFMPGAAPARTDEPPKGA